MTPEEKTTMKKAATLGIIRKIENESLTEEPGIEVYEILSDHLRANYPEFNSDDIEDCVMYAMQSCL